MKRPRPSPALLIAALYLLLAVTGLGRQSLWQDEIHSVRTASKPLAEVALDAHGPIYFLILRLWLQLGSAEWWLRALSVIFGAGALALLYRLAGRLFDRRVALVAGLLGATSPFFLWYSQETRYVILAIAAALLSFAALERALARRGPRAWLAYAAVQPLMVLASVTAVFVPAAQGLYVLASPSRRGAWWRWLGAQTLLVAIFVPWFVASYGALDPAPATDGARPAVKVQVGVARERSPWDVPYSLFVFSSGYSMGPSLRELHVDRSVASLRPHLPAVASIALLFGALAISGSVVLARRHRDRFWLLATWLAIPFLGTLTLSLVSPQSAYSVRYVAVAFPAYLLVLAVSIAAVPAPAVRAGLLALVLAANAVSLVNYHTDPRYAREDLRAASRHLAAVTTPEDFVLLVGNRRSLSHYWRGPPAAVAWSETSNRDPRLVRERLRALADRHRRLWLVIVRPWEKDPGGNVLRALDAEWRLESASSFPGVTVRGYSSPAAVPPAPGAGTSDGASRR